MRQGPPSTIEAPPLHLQGPWDEGPPSELRPTPYVSVAPPRPLAVGVDSLYLGYFSDGIGVDWEGLRFEKEKLVASPGLAHIEFQFGGETFALHRSGKPPYPFRLSNRAFTLGLSERMHPRCHVQFSSELLWSCGLDAAVARFNALWDAIGSKPVRHETVSRVDAAFDFHIERPAFRTDDFVSLATKDSSWRENRAVQSFQFGKGDVVCRVYDKIAEIEQASDKHWLFDIWGARENVWRVEFQVRRERLKQAGISTVEQLKAHLPSLTKHLAQHHTSLRIPSDDSNRSRWPMHPLWQGLIASADQLTIPPQHPPPPSMVGTEYQLYKQLRSVYGDFKGLAATLSMDRLHAPVTIEELFVRFPNLLSLIHAPELWRTDVAKKIRERELGL
jgi:hypothetical protein